MWNCDVMWNYEPARLKHKGVPYFSADTSHR